MLVVADWAPSKQSFSSTWADSKRIPELFQATMRIDPGWLHHALVDDEFRIDGPQDFKVTGGRGIMFCAKDRQTLKDGLGRMLPSIKISDTNGWNLGLFGRSYDFEGALAFIKNKQLAKKTWDQRTPELKADHKEKGLGFGFVSKVVNRQRLFERGYFIIVGRAEMIESTRGSHNFHTSEMLVKHLTHFA